jgi:hypothetical protein
MPDYTECSYDWKISNGEMVRIDNWLGLDHCKPSTAIWDDEFGLIEFRCSQLFRKYESVPFSVFCEQYMKMIRTSKQDYYKYTHLMRSPEELEKRDTRQLAKRVREPSFSIDPTLWD